MSENNQDKDNLITTKFKTIERVSNVNNNGPKKTFKYLMIFFVILLLIAGSIITFLWIKNKQSELETEDLENITQENPSTIFEDEEKKTTETDKNDEPGSNEITEEPKEENEINIEETDITPLETEMVEKKVNIIIEPQKSFFVILSSCIDGDLAKDYATKLSKQGKEVFLIMPRKNEIYHKVALGKTHNLDEAKKIKDDFIEELVKQNPSIENIEKFTQDKRKNIWILKY